jgi:hypothetical protein
MSNGECDPFNGLNITSNDVNAYIPTKTLCGTVSSGGLDPLRTDIPHMYVHVDDDLPIDRPNFARPNSQPISVNFRFKVSNYPSRWNLRISQIQCDGANLMAPNGCAQYYNQNQGNITSLNQKDGEYQKSLDMSVCVKRDPAACAIHYTFHSLNVGLTKGGNQTKPQLGYGLLCSDYIVFNGEKTAICGATSQAKDIILPVSGPQGLTLHTDDLHIPKADVGFILEYKYLHNCTDTVFYKYPTTPGRK